MSKTINAIDALKLTTKRSASIRTLADSFLEKIEQSPRVTPEIGHFYITFDRSLIFVSKLNTPCDCPQCQNRRAGGLPVNVAGMTLFLPPGAIQPINEPADEATPAHKNRDGEPPEFEAIVLRGGHGIKTYKGCEPGDSYVLNADGLAIVGRPDEDGTDTISAVPVAIAGLSLHRPIRLQVVEQAEQQYAEAAGAEVMP